MVERDLKANLNYVIKNKESLLKEHRNKYLLINDEQVIDSFDTYDRAASEGIRQFGMDGNFLVHHLVDKEPLNFVMEALL